MKKRLQIFVVIMIMALPGCYKRYPYSSYSVKPISKTKSYDPSKHKKSPRVKKVKMRN